MADNILADKLVVGPAPHIATADSIPRIMWSVNACLMPALFVGFMNFGWYAMLVVAVSIGAAVISEAAAQAFRGVPVTVSDGSAVLTGLLLALCLPPGTPLYMPAIGSAFAIIVAKHAFGGLGCNVWNPALAGRAFLLAAYSNAIVMPKWPILKHAFTGSILGVDAVTRATPCLVLKETPLAFFQNYSFGRLFLGAIPGSIGETSALALVLGGLYLVYKKYVNWRLPLAFVITVALFAALLPQADGAGGTLSIWAGTLTAGAAIARGIAHALSGGLMLGAIFMATDMVTSPLTSKGQVYYGIGCGLLVALIRLYGGYPEGVCYSILIMNTAVWLIDRLTVPRFFGAMRHAEKNP
ncbi:MAG: RnfABCDGE type electron transport complex subunit D [Proteobacteria bacterium]|nr:RnfABCDGE type electron transport complex subunit D [Pseudomonadota bacterium]